ncbi:hypothetical protein D3C72_1968170 [compost metagenome]
MIENQSAIFFCPPATSTLLNAEHDIGVFRLHSSCEFKQAFRFLFKVAVDQKYAFAASMGKARHHCLVVAKISREVNHCYMSVILCQRNCQVQAVVWGSVVNEDDFIVVANQ